MEMALSPDESLSLYLDVAVQAANEAGERIKAAFYGKDKSIDTKSSFTDLVTATDKQCEDVIKGIIKVCWSLQAEEAIRMAMHMRRL